ncbi:MarR family winged helix-turn-helix transcriptional regulator [Arundinibacter roseus]|uniref:MarR family transcriptional regulator n=1 Tax=Arundinibacter roseus TaxID=2070510 RepID=A0A4R4JZE6_9BACT|nr:MarR family transcriptional regulator [Arundinibacter roseus]TDB59552.1 MarR family transcriptional regulator [Arundinibacter roseus]
MRSEQVQAIRKLGQKYAYTSVQMHEAIARKMGFASTDHKYLGFFLKGKLTAGELAVVTGLTTGSVTALIDRFEKKGLLKREPDSADRRKVYIVPESEKIIALLKPFYDEFQNETEKIIASFSDNEREVIESYLNKSLQLANQTIEKLN